MYTTYEKLSGLKMSTPRSYTITTREDTRTAICPLWKELHRRVWMIISLSAVLVRQHYSSS
jgi:hypothetical protein